MAKVLSGSLKTPAFEFVDGQLVSLGEEYIFNVGYKFREPPPLSNRWNLATGQLMDKTTDRFQWPGLNRPHWRLPPADPGHPANKVLVVLSVQNNRQQNFECALKNFSQDPGSIYAGAEKEQVFLPVKATYDELGLKLSTTFPKFMIPPNPTAISFLSCLWNDDVYEYGNLFSKKKPSSYCHFDVRLHSLSVAPKNVIEKNMQASFGARANELYQLGEQGTILWGMNGGLEVAVDVLN